jgi:hypothetical protein
MVEKNSQSGNNSLATGEVFESPLRYRYEALSQLDQNLGTDEVFSQTEEPFPTPLLRGRFCQHRELIIHQFYP